MKAVFTALTKMLPRALPIAALALALAIGPASGQSTEPFNSFLSGLWKDAAAQGISRATFDLAFAGVTPDARVLGAMQHAPEYGKPVGAYIESIVSPSRIAVGTRKSAQWADTLRAVEDKYGVPASILVSIWGIESSFGDSPDRWDVFRCIATLAQAKIQHPYFRDELISALKILQSHAIARPQLLGSYAGAMGQAQFMPSSYLKYAVDFDGDGRADIWTSVPDVLASIANYLQKSGWQPGLPWGFEVLVPAGSIIASAAARFASGAPWLERLDGRPLPDAGETILFFPSGAPGPAFLVTQNFVVLKTYNNSDAYALAVACSRTGCAARAFSLPGRRTTCNPRARNALPSSTGWQPRLQSRRFRRPFRFRAARRCPRAAESASAWSPTVIRAAPFSTAPGLREP